MFLEFSRNGTSKIRHGFSVIFVLYFWIYKAAFSFAGMAAFFYGFMVFQLMFFY